MAVVQPSRAEGDSDGEGSTWRGEMGDEWGEEWRGGQLSAVSA